MATCGRIKITQGVLLLCEFSIVIQLLGLTVSSYGFKDTIQTKSCVKCYITFLDIVYMMQDFMRTLECVLKHIFYRLNVG